MEIFQFEKCLLGRLSESLNVLSWKNQLVPASQVRSEWSYFMELQIEPAGWQALWKIPRLICEELKFRFPTVVYGTVEQVLFKELKAIFTVQAVQDDDIHLPERHEVNLLDLWPTKIQENSEVNVENTADCIDRLRFFYINVWMPWDYDNDDLNWVEKHLESRIRFCYDRKNKNMKRSLATYISNLLAESYYIQQRREYIEIGLSDDDEDVSNAVDKSQVNILMSLHLRLNMIKNEIEMLENPEMRKIYDDIKFGENNCLMQSQDNSKTAGAVKMSYIVTQACTIEQQLQCLRMAQLVVPVNCLLELSSSYQNVVNVCNSSDDIYLCPGIHYIKFTENLNANGTIFGLTEHEIIKELPEKQCNSHIVIMSPNDDNLLIVFDGDYTLQNVVLDCINIGTGIMAKNGRVQLINCRFFGDGKSSTQRGIVCLKGTELLLENCVIENFATGITLNKFSTLSLKNCKIIGCDIGIDISDQWAHISFAETIFIDSKKCGIYIDKFDLNRTEKTQLKLSSLNQLQKLTSIEIPWKGECIFRSCNSNILIINKNMSLLSNSILNSILNENECDNNMLNIGSKSTLSNSD